MVLVNATMPSWAPRGYLEGKKIAERAAEEFAAASDENGATILYPASISGTRREKIGGSTVSLPLWSKICTCFVFLC